MTDKSERKTASVEASRFSVEAGSEPLLVRVVGIAPIDLAAHERAAWELRVRQLAPGEGHAGDIEPGLSRRRLVASWERVPRLRGEAPAPDLREALSEALDAYDRTEDAPNRDDRRPAEIFVRALAVVRAARALSRTARSVGPADSPWLDAAQAVLTEAGIEVDVESSATTWPDPEKTPFGPRPISGEALVALARSVLAARRTAARKAAE